MNIVLIGYRGTGKSAVGELVARRLGMTCISMDARIVEKAGMSIPRFVEEHGWPAFRDLETTVARELGQQDRLVIDTGGGVIERPQNIPALRANGYIIWLKASVSVIVARIQDGTERPALTQGKSFTQEVGEVLVQRIPKYQDAAQGEIDTDTLTIEQVADRIVGLVRNMDTYIQQ